MESAYCTRSTSIEHHTFQHMKPDDDVSAQVLSVDFSLQGWYAITLWSACILLISSWWPATSMIRLYRGNAGQHNLVLTVGTLCAEVGEHCVTVRKSDVLSIWVYQRVSQLPSMDWWKSKAAQDSPNIHQHHHTRLTPLTENCVRQAARVNWLLTVCLQSVILCNTFMLVLIRKLRTNT